MMIRTLLAFVIALGSLQAARVGDGQDQSAPVTIFEINDIFDDNYLLNLSFTAQMVFPSPFVGTLPVFVNVLDKNSQDIINNTPNPIVELASPDCSFQVGNAVSTVNLSCTIPGLATALAFNNINTLYIGFLVNTVGQDPAINELRVNYADVNGTSGIPEPSTLGFVVGGLVLLYWKRRN